MKLKNYKKQRARIIYTLLISILGLLTLSQPQAAEMYIGGESQTTINEEQSAPQLFLTGDFKLFISNKSIREDCVIFKSFKISWIMPGDHKNVYVTKLGRDGTHWNSAISPNKNVQPQIRLTGVLINRCKSPQKISLEVLLFMKSNPNKEISLFLKEVLLPSPEKCSVRLTPDIIAFGTVSAGKTYYRKIEYNGKGNVEISSSSMKNGRLLLNNASMMEISVPSTFISKNTWKTTQRQGGIPLTLKVGKTVKAGNYKANLTATLSCP